MWPLYIFLEVATGDLETRDRRELAGCKLKPKLKCRRVACLNTRKQIQHGTGKSKIQLIGNIPENSRTKTQKMPGQRHTNCKRKRGAHGLKYRRTGRLTTQVKRMRVVTTDGKRTNEEERSRTRRTRRKPSIQNRKQLKQIAKQ